MRLELNMEYRVELYLTPRRTFVEGQGLPAYLVVKKRSFDKKSFL